MVININTTKKKYFRQALEVVKSLPPLDTLRNKQLDMLAELLYYNYKYKAMPEELRWKILFDYDTKMEMADNLGYSEDYINGMISMLRGKNIIKGKTLTSTFNIDPDNPIIQFNFKIED